jgi:hypothetical protein
MSGIRTWAARVMGSAEKKLSIKLLDRPKSKFREQIRQHLFTHFRTNLVPVRTLALLTDSEALICKFPSFLKLPAATKQKREG